MLGSEHILHSIIIMCLWVHLHPSTPFPSSQKAEIYVPHYKMNSRHKIFTGGMGVWISETILWCFKYQVMNSNQKDNREVLHFPEQGNGLKNIMCSKNISGHCELDGNAAKPVRKLPRWPCTEMLRSAWWLKWHAEEELHLKSILKEIENEICCVPIIF